MTRDEAFSQQIITQIGSACLTIAQQAGEIAELRERWDDVEAVRARLAELESA